MTFTNFSMLPETEGGDGLLHSPLQWMSPGDNIIVRDCIFHHGNLEHPAGSAIELVFQENLWSGNGVYLDVTVKDCEFHDNAFHHSVISSIASCILPGVCFDQDPNLSEPVFQIGIEGCLLKDNTARSVMLLQSSKGSVIDSCLLDNTGQSKSLIQTYDSLDIKFERISEKGTEYMDEVCPDIAKFETVLPSAGQSSTPNLVMCTNFDNASTVCGETENDKEKKGKQGKLGQKKPKKGKLGRRNKKKKKKKQKDLLFGFQQ
jgi:hypothetical protein